MLKSFKMSSYIWALAVLIWVKNVYSWPNVHILLCLVLLLWKKKKVQLWDRKQHGLFQLHRRTSGVDSLLLPLFGSRKWWIQLESIMFLVSDVQRRAKGNLASAMTGWIELPGWNANDIDIFFLFLVTFDNRQCRPPGTSVSLSCMQKNIHGYCSPGRWHNQ